MAHITREEVERVAALARLALSDEEVAHVAGELEAILGYAEQLAGLDTEGIEPTSHVMTLSTPLRDDVAEPAMDPELAVANAPERAGSAFLVPVVIEAEEEG